MKDEFAHHKALKFASDCAKIGTPEQLKEMKEAFIQGVEFAIDNGLQVSEKAIGVYREITKGE